MAVIGASQRTLSPIAPIATEHSSVFQGRDAVRDADPVVFWLSITATATSRMIRPRIFAGFANPATPGSESRRPARARGDARSNSTPEPKRSGSTSRLPYRIGVVSTMKAGASSTRPPRGVARNLPRKSGGAGAVGALDPRCLCVLVSCSLGSRPAP